MDPLEKLPELFARFPGIGTRQSQRFVYFLLRQHPAYVRELAGLIGSLPDQVLRCTLCQRYFPIQGSDRRDVCRICRDTNRDPKSLLVIEKDADLERIERSRIFRGGYFVLGGTLPIVTEKPDEIIRIRELRAEILRRMPFGLEEVIIALSVTPDGEHTAEYVQHTLSDLFTTGIRLTMLGRGLSTGTELEYSDEETLRSALTGRTAMRNISTE